MLDIRRQTGYLFLAVVVGHVILISAQVNARSDMGHLERVTFGALSEVQRTTAVGIGGIRGVWDNYLALRGVKTENDDLRHQVASLRIELQKQRALALESRRLQTLLNLKSQLDIPTLAAKIIAGDTTLGFQTVTIDKGMVDGLRRDHAVIAPGGVVGRVVRPAARAAMVQLLIDRDAAAAALIERSRAGGVVVGTGGEPPLQMKYMSNLADVRVGDTVVTSGLDGIYPKGFVIGRITAAVRGGAGMYELITIQPAVDFRRLEEVLVVTAPAAARPGQEASE